MKSLILLFKLWLKSKLIKSSDQGLTYDTILGICGKFCKSGSLLISDLQFRHYAISDVRDLCVLFPLKVIKGKDETLDCDEYADVFKGLMRFLFPGITIGTYWDDDHAANFFVYAGNIYLIEPQTGVLSFAKVQRKKFRVMII